MEYNFLEIVAIGFAFGVGWFFAKMLFVISISKYIGKPIQLATDDEND